MFRTQYEIIDHALWSAIAKLGDLVKDGHLTNDDIGHAVRAIDDIRQKYKMKLVEGLKNGHDD
jgi:hypothetical protein